MVHAYRQLFTRPGTAAFVLAGLLARLPLSMTGIGLITMLSQQRGAYTLAGAVAACFALTFRSASRRATSADFSMFAMRNAILKSSIRSPATSIDLMPNDCT